MSNIYNALHLSRSLANIPPTEIMKLLKAEKQLTRWHTREAGDGSGWHIERDEETGKPDVVKDGEDSQRYAIRDYEKSAIETCERIAEEYGWVFYEQGDCRGCAVYFLKPEQVGKEDIGSIYNRGVAVCL